MKQFIEHENNNLSSLVEFKKYLLYGLFMHGWDMAEMLEHFPICMKVWAQSSAPQEKRIVQTDIKKLVIFCY